MSAADDPRDDDSLEVESAAQTTFPDIMMMQQKVIRVEMKMNVLLLTRDDVEDAILLFRYISFLVVTQLLYYCLILWKMK